LQVNDTVTSVLFQPLEFAAGLRLPDTAGAALSSLTVTCPVPELPTRSVAVDVLVMPEVLADCESVAGVGPDATPDPESVAAHVMVALELFHPAAFASGDSVAVTVGPVLSRV
jgi:hypothetical protein